jgi:hypothetical protein
VGKQLNSITASVPAGQPGPSGLYLPMSRARQMLPLNDAARNMGIACFAGRGAGKSTLMSLIGLQDSLRSIT